MTAHLRASVYGERNQTPPPSMDCVDLCDEAAAIKPVSFLNLLREYDSQARDNFAKEAVVFTIIIALGMLWPIVHILRALPH